MVAPRRKSCDQLRSARRYGAGGLRAFGPRSRAKQMRFSAEDHAGKPITAILNTWSRINPCHQHPCDRAEAAKRGVLQAGGFPLKMPASALGEVCMKPSTMTYRNLLAVTEDELARRRCRTRARGQLMGQGLSPSRFKRAFAADQSQERSPIRCRRSRKPASCRGATPADTLAARG